VKSISKPRFAQPEFGTPSRPFNLSGKAGMGSLGSSANIFGSGIRPGGMDRRISFGSIDGEDFAQSSLAQAESQSSNDELPPTPTKKASDTPSTKQNSLRSTLLGRRPTLSASTFVPPSDAEKQLTLQVPTSKSPLSNHKTRTPSIEFPKLASVTTRLKTGGASVVRCRHLTNDCMQRLPSPLAQPSLKLMLCTTFKSNTTKINHSLPVFAPPTLPSIFIPPQTPADVTFPDPSVLSISPQTGSPAFSPINSPLFNGKKSAASNYPETPTTHRDSVNTFSSSFTQSITPNHQAPPKEIDPLLLTRFRKVEWYSGGEFSEVYKVTQTAETPIHTIFSPAPVKVFEPISFDKVWIVKRLKSPYTSLKVREKRLQEVEIMKALGKHDNVVSLAESWESNNRLYIQTEFCEEGNLELFLAKTGHKGRLDDFRIWKIMIDLCQVSIQLLKANTSLTILRDLNTSMILGSFIST